MLLYQEESYTIYTRTLKEPPQWNVSMPLYTSKKCMDFTGLRVSHSTIEPLPKDLDITRALPSPNSATDIKRWFGLIDGTL